MKALSQQIYSLSPLAARATPHLNYEFGMTNVEYTLMFLSSCLYRTNYDRYNFACLLMEAGYFLTRNKP